MTERATRQLEVTYAVLRGAHDHPTAGQIFERVRRQLPRISLGTIYRNLDKLQRRGLAHAIRSESGATRYDGVVEPHDHFVCERCETVVDLSAAPAARREDIRRAGHRVRWQTTLLYGSCAACANLREGT